MARVPSGRVSWVGAAGLALLALLITAGRADAATVRTWDGGCGAETAWSCAGNWSGDTVPGPGDTATFNATSSNSSTVDAGFAGTVGSVKVNPGYTGTISLARSLTVSVAFTQKAGTFTAGGQPLTLKALTLTGGAFTASSGTTSIAGLLKISGGPTFDANGGTVDFDGAGGGVLSCGNVAFAHVAITNTKGTKTVDSNCDLPLGNDPAAGSGGSVTLNGTLSGTGTLTNSKTLNLGGTGSLSGFSGLTASVLNVKGAYDFGSYSPFGVSGNFTITPSGDFTAPAGAASFSKNFTIKPGAAFDANGGTIEFDDTHAFSLACADKAFNLVVLGSATGKKTIGGDCELPLGEDPSLGGGGTTLKGTLSGTGELSEAGAFTIASASPGLDSFTDVTDVGSFTLSAGTAFTAPAGELTVNGNFSIDSGASFDANGGTVNFQGLPGASKTITCNGAVFHLAVLSNVANSKQSVGGSCTLPLGADPEIGEGGQIGLNGTLTGSGVLVADTSALTLGASGSLSGFSGFETTETGALTVNGSYDFGAYTPFVVGGDFTLNEGATFAAPAGTASFGGDFIDAGGDFEADEGTVVLGGGSQQIKGSTTFFNLEKVATAADTLTFEAGATQTVEGDLTLKGAEAAKRLSLVSSTSPTRWLIEVEGTADVRLATVKDSKNLGAPIDALESVDMGNNEGWNFL